MKAKKNWDKIISHQETSGLTIAAYCKANKISPASFYKHKKQSSQPQQFCEVNLTVNDQKETFIFGINGVSIEVPEKLSNDNLVKIIKAILYD